MASDCSIEYSTVKGFCTEKSWCSKYGTWAQDCAVTKTNVEIIKNILKMCFSIPHFYDSLICQDNAVYLPPTLL